MFDFVARRPGFLYNIKSGLKLVNQQKVNRAQFQSIIFFMVFLLFFFFCEKPQIEQSEEKILVRIDNKKTISLNEFIRRAEYTIRPPYCKNNTYIHKKIILNSLIAEKIFAMEAGENNPLLNNEEFQQYIKGRREQAMRQWMHH